MKIKDNQNLKINFENENVFKKRLSTLRVYNMKAVKNYFFDELILEHIQDNLYKINLNTDEKFKLVYGQIYILCRIDNDILTIIDVEPKYFLDRGFMCVLDTYKGIPVASEKDLAKIKILEKLGRIQ